MLSVSASIQPIAGVLAAGVATNLVANVASPSINLRHTHRHTLTRTASACRISITVHTRLLAARLDQPISSSCHVHGLNLLHHYQSNSASRSIHAGNPRILAIKPLLPQSNSFAFNAPNPSITAKSHSNQPFSTADTAGAAINSGVISAQRTSDIVWLVEEEVTLPDGTTTRALVPRVYAKLRPQDLSPDGSLLAGIDTGAGGLSSIGAKNINMQLGDNNLSNSGTIAARQTVLINAGNIHNLQGASISGQAVGLSAKQDINITGSTVAAAETLIVTAGHNLNVTSTTQSSSAQGGKFTNTSLDRMAGLYVGNAAMLAAPAAGSPVNPTTLTTNPITPINPLSGLLIAKAGGDINLTAAQIVNATVMSTSPNPLI